jgi:cytochrome c-type biogenesis protein CcmH
MYPIMTFWIAAAGLTGLTCLALLAALGRRGVVTADHDRVFYEAQVREIERQLSLKLIGEAEADAARTEAARRLLAVTPDTTADITDPARLRNLAAAAMLVLIPAIALPVYLARGVPDMPSFPLARRQPDKPAAPQDVNVVAALEQIETHLAKNPDDGRGHEVVGPVYLRLGRHADAARAFAAALRLLGPTADRHASLGEALVFGGNGIVTAEARTAFEAAAILDAKHIKSRFFLALAAQQEGDKPKAVELLSALRHDLPDGDLKAEIGKQLAELGAVPKGGDMIAALPAEDQAAAIRSMVEGLAQRLASTGGSAEEWARLIRALTVLKETDRARMILAEARQKFAAQPDDLRRIEDAGKGL